MVRADLSGVTISGDSVLMPKDLFVVTNEGFAKRTAISEYRLQGRNGLGIKAVQLVEGRAPSYFT